LTSRDVGLTLATARWFPVLGFVIGSKAKKPTPVAESAAEPVGAA
jgi:hypothetical protein